MTTSTATPPSATPDKVAEQLGLAYPGQTSLLAELGEDPHTIGGGPKCTVRLSGSGIRPLHCVVTAAGDDRVARSWAPGTQLNGSDFTEAALSAGDLLRIGPVDIQVVALPDDQAVENVEEARGAACVPKETPACDNADEPADTGVREAESAAVANFDWIDDSVAEVEQAIVQATDADDDDEPASIDPAIPSHLLKPWVPADGQTPTAPRDTASSIVELNNFATDNETTAPEDTAPENTAETVFETVFEDAPAEPVEGPADEWAVTPAEKTPEPESLPANPTSASAWEAEYAQTPAPAAPEAAADAVTPTPEPLPEPEAVEPGSVEPQADESAGMPAAESDWARLRRQADRERVGRLIGALREHRQRLTTLESAIAERDTTIQESWTDLTAAIGAADQAATELARLAETTERLEATEAELAEARQQIAALEQRLAALDAIETTTPIAEEPSEPTVAPEPVEELHAKAVEEAEAIEEPSAEEASPSLGESLWAAEEPVAEEQSEQADSPQAPFVEATPHPESPQEGADAWGIEQLADTSADPADSLWGGFGEAAAPAEEAAEQPIQEPTPTPEEALFSPVTHEDLPAEVLFGVPSEPIEEGLVPAELAPVETTDEELALEELNAVETVVEVVEVEEAAPEPTLPGEEEESSLWNDPEATETQPAPLAAFQPKPSEPTAEGAGEPASFIEQYAHMLPDEDAPIEAIAPVEPAPLNETPNPGLEGDGDESIDDYMRKLMQRVRGESDPAPAAESIIKPTPAALTPADAPQAPANEAPAVSAPKPVEEDSEPIRCLSELKATSRDNPTTDLKSLRQIANQSARQAIDVASTKQSREQAFLRLTGAAVALGFGALAVVTASTPFGFQFVAGVLGAAGGGWFGVRTLRACQLASREEEMAAAAKGTPIA